MSNHSASFAIQQTFSEPCLVNIISKDTHLVFSIYMLTVPPEIDDSNLDKNPKINKGHTATLYCPVVGNPPPEILWLKGRDREPVQLDSRITMLTDGNQLRIQNASVADTATYTCRARNKAGQASVSFDLEVQGKVGFTLYFIGYF